MKEELCWYTATGCHVHCQCVKASVVQLLCGMLCYALQPEFFCDLLIPVSDSDVLMTLQRCGVNATLQLEWRQGCEVQRPGFYADVALRPPQTFEQTSEFLQERF